MKWRVEIQRTTQEGQELLLSLIYDGKKIYHEGPKTAIARAAFKGLKEAGIVDWHDQKVGRQELTFKDGMKFMKGLQYYYSGAMIRASSPKKV